MTDHEASEVVRIAGPRPDEHHRYELPGNHWVTCRGCPMLRVHDFHYFYCRHLGEQSKPDAWFPSGGWHRLWGGIVWKSASEVPCRFPEHLEGGL